MAAPTKSEALSLFSYPVPGYQIVSSWVEEKLVPPPENVGLILPGRSLLTAPLPWAQFENSLVQIPVVSNVGSWSSTAQWSAQNGTVINSDAPTWTVESTELSQLAAQLIVDTAVDVSESVYNVYDTALRALAEMMMVATYKQLFSKTPDANGPDSLFDIATADSHVVDAGGEPLSFRLLMCLRQQLNLSEGLPQQYSIVMGLGAYAEFVELMTGVGLAPTHDPVMGREAWFFDRVRVVESSYVPSADAVMFKADMTVLSEEDRERVSAGVGRGVLLASTHAPGVVVSNSKAIEASDQSLATLQMNVGLVHCGDNVAWLSNVSA